METATEPTLFETAKSNLQKAFDAFDADNPQIWREFRDMAFRLIDNGYKHYGAKSIIEAIRFHRSVQTTEGPFKLNNNYTAYYARKFMNLYPQHEKDSKNYTKPNAAPAKGLREATLLFVV